MRLTPRGDEVKAVVAILEDDSYDDATAMAKALIKEVAELLWQRDWLALTHRFDEASRGINYGPFAMEAEATKFAQTVAPGGRFSVVKLNSPGRQLGVIEGNTKSKGACQECGHADWMHRTEGNSRTICLLSDDTCPCKKFKR